MSEGAYNLQSMIDGVNELFIREAHGLNIPNHLTEMWCYMRHISKELDELNLANDPYQRLLSELKDEIEKDGYK